MNIFLIFALLLTVTDGTISPKKNRNSRSDDDDDDTIVQKPKPQKPKKPPTAPQSKSVFDRNLVKQEMTYREIITEHAAYSTSQMKTRRIQTGETLVYVTPWNNHGYDIAKWFHKFTLVAPVWLQLKGEGVGLTVKGTHDVDRGWMDEVRETGAKIVPRIIFELHPQTMKQLLSDEESIKGVTDILLRTVLEHDLDGLVVEIWNTIQRDMCNDVIHLMTHLADALHGNGKKLILVIPPKKDPAAQGQMTPFTGEHFEQLVDVVDYFSLMTYDYMGQLGAFNAPIPWIREAVEELDSEADHRSKILLGMNFYGRYIPNVKQQGIVDLLGRDYVKRLTQISIDLDAEVAWHPEAKEHYIFFQDPATDTQSVILYPTLYSIQQRIEQAQLLGCGLSIWEIGQGLDYFYDLF